MRRQGAHDRTSCEEIGQSHLALETKANQLRYAYFLERDYNFGLLNIIPFVINRICFDFSIESMFLPCGDTS